MKNEYTPDDYADIIDLPYRPVPDRPRMSPHDRAAQFAPFAALTGYGAEILEAGRLTEDRREMSEEEFATLNERVRLLAEHPEERPPVSVVYFRRDPKKQGGAYLTLQGQIKELDAVGRTITFCGGRKLSLDDLLQIDSPFFSRFIPDCSDDLP